MPKLMEVIDFLDDTGQVMVCRIPASGQTEIKWGAQLTVRESQVAVFFRDGKALDVFGPGRYVLQTQNVPIITKWVTSFGYGPQSPFRAEVYFLSMKLFPNLKWGTREPLLFKDAELKMVRLRSHGIFSMQITEPSLFLNKIIGTQGVFTQDNIEEYLRNIITSRINVIIANEIKTVFDMPKEINHLSLAAKSALLTDFEGLGLSLHDFYISSISVPQEVQIMIDTRSGMSAVGNMDEFMKYKTALALQSAAENPSGTAATGVGLGAGMGMGLILPQYIANAVKGEQADKQQYAADKIRKLKELLDMGAISQEEFECKKKTLLTEM